MSASYIYLMKEISHYLLKLRMGQAKKRIDNNLTKYKKQKRPKPQSGKCIYDKMLYRSSGGIRLKLK